MRKHPAGPQEKTTLPNTPERQAAQKKYNAKPEQLKRRAERNKARRQAIASGQVSKGDGRDVDHKNGNTSEMGKNLRVLSESANRKMNRRSSKTKANLEKAK